MGVKISSNAKSTENTENKKENPHENHRERMRKRFRENGFNGFDDHQIIELLLFYTCPRKDTNVLAHTLINRFGSIAGILDASYEDLISIKGISENSATLFKIIPKMLSVYYNSRSDGMVYDNFQKLKELFTPHFVGLTHEEFRLACFNNNLQVVSNILISAGAPSFTYINARKIVEEAFRVKSDYVVLAHNHPNGSPAPSIDDVNTTRSLNRSLKALGINLLDHVIIGKNSSASMRELACIDVFD